MYEDSRNHQCTGPGLAFFVFQAWLVWCGRTDLHIRLGPYFAAYGVLLVILDYWVGMVIEARRVALGETVDRVLPMTFAIVRDLVMFAGFLVARIIYRRKPARRVDDVPAVARPEFMTSVLGRTHSARVEGGASLQL